MSNEKDGGPAPAQKTLRDEFAMAALAGISGVSMSEFGFNADQVAREVYRIADAMLRAREGE